MKNTAPNYKKIYSDIITKIYPDKKNVCQSLLDKTELSSLDIIKLNNLIFKSKNNDDISFDKRHRSYNKKAIQEITDYQKKQKLNNSQLANHFNLSRTTVTKWKKKFL